MESFLPRLHWVASQLAPVRLGTFIKWTGDGFLVWFEVPLHRDLGPAASNAFYLIDTVSRLVSTTQLGVDSPRRVELRHGLTYEQDALITTITFPGGMQLLDLLGREVVLAFRLSSRKSAWPSIVTQKEILDAVGPDPVPNTRFRRWTLSSEDRLRYFKGEVRKGLKLYETASPKRKAKPLNVQQYVKRARKMADSMNDYDPSKLEEAWVALIARANSAPAWARELAKSYSQFLIDEHKEARRLLRRVADTLDKQE